MRSDYALYAVAVIFFLITVMVFFAQPEPKELWIMTTAVLGFIFIAIGYTQRPKIQTVAEPLPPPTSPPPAVTEAVERYGAEASEEAAHAAEASQQVSELARVKGIGAKRSEQLRAHGVNTLKDLARASTEDLASKLKISPKIVGRWINEAKALVEEA